MDYLPGPIFAAVAFSAGGDGGGKSPKHPAQVAHIEFAAAGDCQTTAVE